jgi:hypothetical protein
VTQRNFKESWGGSEEFPILMVGTISFTFYLEAAGNIFPKRLSALRITQYSKPGKHLSQ